MPGRALVQTGSDWQALRADFAWPKPARFNITDAVCDAWARADPGRLALRYLRPDGAVRDWTYAQLARASARFGEVLKAHGITRGDRVAVLLPQTPEAAVTHLAAYRIGAVVLPLFTLFGEDALAFRLGDAGAKAVVTDGANLPKILAIRDRCPELTETFSIDERQPGIWSFWHELGKAADGGAAVATGPDGPAFIAYTSGTTGPPKGALHGHRVLIGHLPGIELAHEGLGQEGDCFWTPADWAWMGGLANALLPALYHGVPVIAHRMAKFDPERVPSLVAELGIRNVFLPPTSLRLMRQAGVKRVAGLRSVASAGEVLGAEMLHWGREVFGREINEFYGQTECNAVVGNAASVAPVKPGSTGRAIPGHEVAIIDGEGRPLPAGESGEIAVRRPDPVMFLGYWGQPEKTAEKFTGDWLRTGDEGMMDGEGHVFFAARIDDVITSSGYRIGPSEIEDCLAGHPSVAMAAAVGVPDPIRTEVVRAFVVVKEGAPIEGLEAALMARVRERISPHVVPREVVIVTSLPMTATGKIQRRLLRDHAADGRGPTGAHA